MSFYDESGKGVSDKVCLNQTKTLKSSRSLISASVWLCTLVLLKQDRDTCFVITFKTIKLTTVWRDRRVQHVISKLGDRGQTE